MDTHLLDIKFARIGARLKVADRPTGRSRTAGVISLDVQTDRPGPPAAQGEGPQPPQERRLPPPGRGPCGT
jgi:hypothetical protein